MKKWKGIVLAGGHGTRLYPITKTISKQLLPVYDKPMIYYALSILMIAGIRKILIICNKENINNFKKLLGSGDKLGIELHYKIQNTPEGIPDAFKISTKFIGKDNVSLILGDNIFYGQNLKALVSAAMNSKKKCNIFLYKVANPEDYGVVKLDNKNKIVSIKEKPKNADTNLAITGLYFFDNSVIKNSKKLKKSSRGEYEITDLIKIYKVENQLSITTFGRGFAWLDTGTHASLLSAGQFVETIEKRQGLKIACIEEIAYRNNWITKKELLFLCKNINNHEYKNYLKRVIDEN